MTHTRHLTRARELAAELLQLDLAGEPALVRHGEDLREVLGTEIALSYSLIEVERRLVMPFFRVTGLANAAQHRSTIERWFGSRSSRSEVAAYNPLRPEPRQQNRVLYPRQLRPEGTSQRTELLPRIGLAAHEQMRVLLCRGGTLLAWIGALQRSPFASWHQTAFEILLPALRKRVSAERTLQDAGFYEAALDVSLGLFSGSALVVDRQGQVRACNQSARAWLSRDRAGLQDMLTRTRRGEATSLQLIPFREKGMKQHALVLQQPGGHMTSRELVAEVAERAQLSEKLRQVLELLLDGLENTAIAQLLHNSVSTIEKHVSKLLRQFDVENRAALIRAVTDRASAARASVNA